MLLKVALLVSMLVQLGAAIIAVSLIRRTRYNISWILISLGFVLMAVRRLIEFSSLFWETQLFSKENVNSWFGVLISVLMIAGLFFIRQIFNLNDRIEELRKGNETRLLSAIIQGEEKARQSIARDLHDGLGPLLSSIKMIISATDIEKLDPNNRKIIERSGLVTDEAIVTLKEISNHLSPHLLKNFGLIKAIETLSTQLFENSRIDFQLITNINEVRFYYDLEIGIYRVVSELLSNSMKHSGATVIKLKINKMDALLQMEYTDNGKGFSTEENKDEIGFKGMGLENIRSRIKSLNGHVLINSEPGMGINVFIQTPLKWKN
ncbi:MAG: sensor histidine kinase [Prolixibacteraceae bacterium]|jgi:signal transduction histidine kinase|nr:sensor histidine kinase [Prolixibacteraceae bacterium]